MSALPFSRRAALSPVMVRDAKQRRQQVFNTIQDDQVQSLLTSCGISIYRKGTGPGTGKRAVIQYGFHSLRHSTVSLMQAAGVPLAGKADGATLKKMLALLGDEK